MLPASRCGVSSVNIGLEIGLNLDAKMLGGASKDTILLCEDQLVSFFTTVL